MDGIQKSSGLQSQPVDKFSKEDLDRMRNVPIYTILGIKFDGRKQSIKCPFHNESTPSCVIFPDNGYYCFGCKAVGFGAIDFLEDLGCTFKEATEELKKYI
jgi:DNA primase